MALKVVHYALIGLAVALCIAFLYWRWRRVSNQNKALEAELRLVQPYNNIPEPVPEVVALNPPLQFQPVEVAKTAAPAPVAATAAPPVLTPKPMTVIKEEEQSDDDDDDAVGAPPTVEDLMFVDFSHLMQPPPIEASSSSIVELPADEPADEPAPVAPEPARAVRRRRK